MAWYLSEVLTDLSYIKQILSFYKDNESEDMDAFSLLLADYLRVTEINTDHINADSIPEQYNQDEYRWLAVDTHQALQKLQLITHVSTEDESHFSYMPSEQGVKLLNDEQPLSEIMKECLSEWKNSSGIRPYQEIKELLEELRNVNLYPCSGVLLLEVLLILLKLNKQHGNSNLFRYVHTKRKEYYPHMTGDVRIDLILYSDFLWEQLSQDLSNYYAADYPVRSTLLLMMYSDELIYGDVPIEIFGLIQYITLA